MSPGRAPNPRRFRTWTIRCSSVNFFGLESFARSANDTSDWVSRTMMLRHATDERSTLFRILIINTRFLNETRSDHQYLQPLVSLDAASASLVEKTAESSTDYTALQSRGRTSYLLRDSRRFLCALCVSVVRFV